MPRKTFFRDHSESFLIVCEGEKTEELYFRAFRVPGDTRTIKVEGLGKNTVSLVKEAIKLKEKGEYDQVWVVFDIDDYGPDQVYAAIREAAEHGIQVAYSNQAFELWYLLHFNYHQTALDRCQYEEKLSRLLGFKYEKNKPGMYLRLLSRQECAIKNAIRLLDLYNPHNPCKDDPCTTVFRLVQELNRFTPDSRRNTR